MPRKKPTSLRQKKEQTKLHRAIKRGDEPPLKPQLKNPRKRIHSQGHPEHPQKLDSSFLKVSRQYLEKTKAQASTIPLPRPISLETAILTQSYADADAQLESLSCPRRPKWRYDMSKKDVEANEEGLFKKWLTQTEVAFEKWRVADEDVDQPETVIRSPSSFERNLEVWRQLWRVTEISQIILVLVDSRCPLLHFPPSLASYLSNHKVILVLTKIDISGPIRVAAWAHYFRINFPGLRVVQVQSYARKEVGVYHQGRVRYGPQIPQTFREQLVNAIRSLHAEMLEPPEKVKANLRWLKDWKPPVKRDIDWSTAMNFDSQPLAIQVSGDTMSEEAEPSFLTIGLVGQPNVGKSSLLNALFGQPKVRASKTPGKTKHYQTHFLTPEIRLVDCPGLVIPNYVPMEMQVLSGVLPISRVSAIPACVHYASQFLPLEDIFKLTHPKAEESPVADNRSWREGMKHAERVPIFWTAMDILVAFANKKGWVTAKAGRPDFSRAGNAILRALAEGQVHWGFWPPGTPLIGIELDRSDGIWIKGNNTDIAFEDENEGDSDMETEMEEEDTEEGEGRGEDVEDDDADDVVTVVNDEDEGNSSEKKIDDDEDAEFRVPIAAIRFAALQIGEEDEIDSSDSE